MATLSEAWVNIGVNTAPLTAGLTQAEGKVAKATMQMQARLKTLGTTMTIVGAIGTAAFALTVKSAMKFEKEMAQVSTMLDTATMSIMPKYKQALLSMSAAFGEGTDTLAKGLYDILSASIDSSKALDVLEEAAKAAVAGITDTGVAADAITTILNSYGLEAEDAGKVSDQLFGIVKRGKTTFAELAPAIGKVAATAAKSGLSFEELGASIATITRAGIRTDEAMTAVNGILRAFLKPTDDAKRVAAEFGLTLDTNTLKTEGLIGAMNKLKDATTEQIAQMFPNIRGLKGVISAMGDLTGYTKDYELLLNSAGLTQAAFEKQTATTAFKLEQLKKTFGVISVQIGDVLIPIVSDLIVRVGKVVTKISEWISANKPLVETIVKLGAALSVFTMAGGILILANLYFARLNIAVKAMGATAKGAIPSINGLKVSLNSLGGAALLAGANIILWSEVWKTWKEVSGMAKTSTNDVTNALIRLSDQQEIAAKKLGITPQEFVKWQKEGKTVTEMMDTLARRFPGYADALKVWDIAVVEQQVNAKLIATTVKDLTQNMNLLTKEYGASSQALSENITYYTSMIDLLNRTDVILQTELMLLERGTEEWHKKKEEIADNAKALKDINKELAELTEPLEGLELIVAKMAALGDSTEDTRTKIELLKEQAIILKGKLDEAIPDTKAWHDLNIAYQGTQTEIGNLTAKLSELTEAEKEAIENAKKLADAYKTITDKIYELTHTPMENAIRKLDQQKQEYLKLGVAIKDVNKWYDLQIAKLHELNPELDETTKKLKEAGEAGKKSGEFGADSWDNLTITIERATVSLNNFTKEGLAAAIATVKMKFFPLMNSLVDTINNTMGLWKKMAEYQLAEAKKTMQEQIDTLMYGLNVYNDVMTQMNQGGFGGGFNMPSYQHGTPFVPETGMAMLHKGEAVIPANQNTYNNAFSPTVNLSVQGGGSSKSIAQEVESVLYDMGRQFKRRGFEIIPGRG